jgi:peroxiredoxin
VGQKAPDFTLQDSQRRPVALRDFVGPGKPWVVLIFYGGYW